MRLVENERYEVTVKCSYEYFPVNYVLYFRGVYYCEDGSYMGKPYFKFSVDFTYSTKFYNYYPEDIFIIRKHVSQKPCSTSLIGTASAEK